MLADIQRRVEYSHSLQETLDNNYREMTKEEMTLEEKVQLSTRSVNGPAFFYCHALRMLGDSVFFPRDSV